MKKSWSRGLVKSRLKNGRESRSRETEVGEKIASTNRYSLICQKKGKVYDFVWKSKVECTTSHGPWR